MIVIIFILLLMFIKMCLIIILIDNRVDNVNGWINILVISINMIIENKILFKFVIVILKNKFLFFILNILIDNHIVIDNIMLNMKLDDR